MNERLLLFGGFVLLICIGPTSSQTVEDEDLDTIPDYDVIIEDAEDASKFGSSSGSFFSDSYDYSNGNPVHDQAAMKPMDTAIITIYSVITVVGLIANAIVFFVIFAGNETGKTVTAIYVLQLTIADTVFLFTLPVFSMQKVLDNWRFGSGVCKLCQTIKFMNYYAGIFFLMAMSVDRYIAVAYSTRLTQVRTKRRTYIVCGCMWVAAVLMSIPLMMYARTEEGFGVTFCKLIFPGYIELDPGDGYIDIYDYYDHGGSGSGEIMNERNVNISDFEISDTYKLNNSLPGVESKPFICEHESQSDHYKSWLIIDFIIAFMIPFLVIVVSYVKILTHLKTAEDKIGHTATNKAVKMRKRVTRMVAALVVCFTVCWLPHHLFMLARIKGFHSTVPVCHGIEEFFVALAFSNSAINPILYTFMGNNFKERFKKSVKNTQLAIKRRHSSMGSGHRRSTNSHSDPTNTKRAGLIVHYRKGSCSRDQAKNGRPKPQKKLSQLALLGRKERPPAYDDVVYDSGDQDTRNGGFCGTTTIGEQTMETKI
ncbi:somatostatin receptor type 2-like [Styela clava]